jgi:hypothetical protein
VLLSGPFNNSRANPVCVGYDAKFWALGKNNYDLWQDWVIKLI